MATSVIDLADKTNPPPDDPAVAPYGYRWDTRKKEWVVKRSAGGRKSGSAWFGKNILGLPEAEVVEQPEQQNFFGGLHAQPGEDPKPSWMDKPPRKQPVKRAPPKVTKQVKDDLTASVGLVGMLILPPIVNKDPYCGQALMDNYQSIADALVPLLCKSSTVVSFFADSGSDWMMWFKLAMALAPVAAAVGRHHILKTVEIQQDKDTGDLYVVPRNFEDYSTEPAEEEVEV